MIQQEQTNLNALYDAFIEIIQASIARANESVFVDDSSFCLLSLPWKFWMMRKLVPVKANVADSAQSGSIPKLSALIPHIGRIMADPWAKKPVWIWIICAS